MKACTHLAHIDNVLPLYDYFIYCFDRASHFPKTLSRTSLKAVEYIQSVAQKKVFILSNNSSNTREELANFLQKEYGLAIPQNCVYNSSYLAAKLLVAKYPSVKTVYYLGTEGLRSELTKAGLKAYGVEDNYSYIKDQRVLMSEAKARGIDAVVVSFDNHFNAYKIFTACFAVEFGAKFLVTSRENSLSTSEFDLPGTGAIVAGIEVSTGKAAELVGKPDELAYNAILDENGIKDKKRVLVIGSSVDIDICGATNAGLDACYFCEEEKEAEFSLAKYWASNASFI